MMKKAVFFATVMLASGIVIAQGALASEPEATLQEQVEIEEVDVDRMIDEYLAAKGWNEGENVKADGSKFFVAKGTGIIVAPRDSKGYINSRVNAYNKAMLDAKAKMVEFLETSIVTETMLDYAEGVAVNPPQTEVGSLKEKLKEFLYAKLNKILATEGIDPLQNPDAARKALGEQLSTESYKKTISLMAQAKVVGFQSCCTFEGVPASGQGQIGVVAIWSEKLSRTAESIVSGIPLPPSGTRKLPIAQQVSDDPQVLASSFGVQQLIDENGDLVLVGFGQAGGVSESARSLKSAADSARRNAMAAIREFAGEQVAVTSDAMAAETSEEFESGFVNYANEAYKHDRIRATASKMNISGIAALRNVKAKHPLTNRTICISVVTWSPKQAESARQMKERMAKPITPAQQKPKPEIPQQVAPEVLDGAFKNQGVSADDDAF